MSDQSTSAISLSLLNESGISGNMFYGDELLLEATVPDDIDTGVESNAPTVPTSFPCYGIWFERVNGLTIGYTNAQFGSALNYFLNFGQQKETGIRTQGIRLFKSNVTIRNSVFRNFGVQNFPTQTFIVSDAIYAANNSQSAINSVNFIGVNNTSTDPLGTFNNCYYDIRTVGSHLIAKEFTSFNAVYSILCTPNSSMQPPISYEINGNTITNFRNQGITIMPFKQAHINIEGNTLSDIADPEEIFSPRYGILLDKFLIRGTLDLNGTKIFNNEVHSSSNFTNGIFRGIALSSVFKVHVEHNRIFDDLPESDLTSFQGIATIVAPCDGLRIYSNTVIGAKTDYPKGVGINIEESVNCVLNCNETDNINIGMNFRGMCDMPNKFGKNSFNRHAIGLQLGENGFASIGEQVRMENRWPGADSPVEAKASNSGSAESSKFWINSSDQSSEYWPSPRKIGTVDDNGQWFKPLTAEEPSNDFTCLRGKTYADGSFGHKERSMLDGTFTSPFGYPALDWEARWQFANRLNTDSNLREQDQAAQEYYEESYNETYSRLSRAYQSYLNRWAMPTYIEELAEAQATAVNARFDLDNQLTNGTNTTSLHTQMLNQDASIAAGTAALSNSFQHWSESVDVAMATLLEEVDGITCSQEYEEDLKSVLLVLIESHFTSNILTDENLALMKQISAKCRYSGGYAVVLARGFFEPQEVYAPDVDCEVGERGKERNAIFDNDISLSPNPAGSSVTLNIGKYFQKGVVRLFNGHGMLISEQILTNRTTVLRLSGLPNGIYHAVVSLDGNFNSYITFLKQ